MIELSHDGPPDLEFSADGDKGNITVALLHSASNLKGYEVVIKQVDPEDNEWKDLETTNIWHASGVYACCVEIKWRQVVQLKVVLPVKKIDLTNDKTWFKVVQMTYDICPKTNRIHVEKYGVHVWQILSLSHNATLDLSRICSSAKCVEIRYFIQ